MIHLVEAETAKPAGNRTVRHVVVGMCDMPPVLSAADVRYAGTAHQASPLNERRRLSAQVALQQTGSAIGGPNRTTARRGPPRTTVIAKMHRLVINRGQGSALPVRAAASVWASFLDGSGR